MGKKRDFAKEEEELIASVLHDQKERMSKSRSSSNSSNSYSQKTESRSFFDKFVDENSYDKQDGIKEKSSTDYGTKEITFESLCKTILPNYSSTGKTEEKTTYHYDVKEDGNVSKEPYRSIDNCGRKETASSIYYQKHCNGVESLSLKQDTFKYDTNAQLSDRIVSGNKTTRSVDIYHSHDGVNTKAIFQNGKLVMA